MNTMMKLTATLPAVALLAACSTTTPTAPTTPATPTNGTSDMAYDRMAPAPYTCTDDSQILAKQSICHKRTLRCFARFTGISPFADVGQNRS